MDEELFNQFEQSVKSTESLIELVSKLKLQGLNQLEIYCLFDDYYKFLQQENREDDYDNIDEVLSCIYGWCSPGERLFENHLTNEEIEKFRSSNKL